MGKAHVVVQSDLLDAHFQLAPQMLLPPLVEQVAHDIAAIASLLDGDGSSCSGPTRPTSLVKFRQIHC